MRVAIADDGPLWRDCFGLLLERMGFEVIAQAIDGEQIIELAKKDVPDIAILDIAMPPGDDGGLIAAEHLRNNHPTLGLLLLSHYKSTQFALRLPVSDTGGSGYLIKDHVENRNMLGEAIRRIAAGELVVDPDIVRRLVNRKHHSIASGSLSEQQKMVLELVACGYSNKGIANRLHLSTKTVDRHVSNILDKLGVPADEKINRRAFMILAYLRASHVCDSRCTSPCRTIFSGFCKY
jgi:DNA-binding NarL/FixJ family response regulator